MELTQRRGINILLNSQKVYDFVVNVGYEEEIELSNQDIMNQWLVLPIKLAPISHTCNDQAKQDDAKIAKFEENVVAYVDI